MTALMVEARGVRKHYGSTEVLKGVDLFEVIDAPQECRLARP